jgi:hypothetical protein
MKKIKLLLPLLFPFFLHGQVEFLFFGEGGYSACMFRSAELPVFFGTYNSYHESRGLTTPFDTEMGLSDGYYFSFGGGIGSEKLKAVLAYGHSVNRTKTFEARFANGYGRNVWMQVKAYNPVVGVRFGSEKFYVQPEFTILVQYVRIFSQRVFPDGSTSFGRDNTLNGVYENFQLSVAPGMSFGVRVIPRVFVTARVDYLCNFNGKHPEYHQYSDLNLLKQEPTTHQEFLPRDMTEYYANPWNGSGNSIYNDIRGLRFSAGLQFQLGGSDE